MTSDATAVSEHAVHSLPMLSTGVPGLDDVLGGGLPSLSFNLIAGGPGSGKTTLTTQFMFANATKERPGLFITLLGEPSLKMLRYQQRFEFFDVSRIGVDVHFLNLSDNAVSSSLKDMLAAIVAEVDRLRPGIVVVDSFRSLVRARGSETQALELEQFVQSLALHLTTWEITSFLIGEYQEGELKNPVFTVADGIIWLSQAIDRNSVVRKLQVVKMRGMASMPGLHTLRISDTGVRVFPRTPEQPRGYVKRSAVRLSTGIPGLDEMMGGGIPAGDSVVLAGPTGTGKTTFALQFVAAGLRRGESAVIAIFEEHPDAYLDRANHVGIDFRAAIKDNKLRVIYLRPLDLSVDETLEEIRLSVAEVGATRVVIDSISGFEMALAPTFREDFRESFYRLIGALTGLGITMFSTVEVVGGDAGLHLTGYQVSFLTDEIISQRYVEIEGELRKALVIVKMRGSNHSREFRTYELTVTGVQLTSWLRDYDGILTGVPTRQLRPLPPTHPGLTEMEILILDIVTRSGGMPATQVVIQTGLSTFEVGDSLARLVRLRYAEVNDGLYQWESRPRGSI